MVVAIFERPIAVPSAMPMLWMPQVYLSTIVRNVLFLILRACPVAFVVIKCSLFIESRFVPLVHGVTL